MKTLFSIENENEQPLQPVLLLRLGETETCYAIVDKSNNKLHQLEYFAAEEEWSKESLLNFFTDKFNSGKNYFEVHICYDYLKNNIIPAQTEVDSKSLLGAIYGANNNEVIVTENIPGWPLQNTYAVPVEVKETVTERLPAATFKNHFTIQLAALSTIDEDELIRVDFRQNTFSLVVIKKKNLLLAKTFEYNSPQDVLYYLLKTCQQFSLQQETVHLQVSGLIVSDSALYKELYSYFININFRESNWKDGDEYPAHFFTTINDLFTCAS